MQSHAQRTPHTLLSFLAFVAFFQAMGGLMGWITAQGTGVWYDSLNRSPLNPPDAAFGIAWTALYFLLSIALWLIWRKVPSKERTLVLWLFGIHMVLNWAWSPLFFVAHQLFASYILILLLIFTAAMLAWLIWPLDKRAALTFGPYLLWLTFAEHLAQYIWLNN